MRQEACKIIYTKKFHVEKEKAPVHPRWLYQEFQLHLSRMQNYLDLEEQVLYQIQQSPKMWSQNHGKILQQGLSLKKAISYIIGVFSYLMCRVINTTLNFMFIQSKNIYHILYLFYFHYYCIGLLVI